MWIYNVFLDCQCNITGSQSTDCDSYGQCACKTNLITGQKCSECKNGHINFPDCSGISLLLYVCILWWFYSMNFIFVVQNVIVNKIQDGKKD